MIERLYCLVPFCNCTTAKPAAEWICQKHWSVTSRTWRKRLFLFRRRGRRDLEFQMWERLKRQAIERAGGIT